MAIALMVIQILGLVAELYPKMAPAIKDILDSFKSEKPDDITQAEFEARIDAAIAALPEWKD